MRITRRPELAARTTLGLGGTCEAELVIESAAEAGELATSLRSYGLPVYVLGHGSNILGLDGHHELVLVRPSLKEGPVEVSPSAWPEAEAALPLMDRAGTGEVILVHAGAGVALPRLLAFCRERGLSGLEGLAGIPGSVGGAVAMNAGSFGAETAGALACVSVISSGEVARVSRAGFRWGYRHFSIPSLPPMGEGAMPPVIAGAVFALTRAEPAAVAARMQEHFQVKKSRQPIASRSAGCVFKNPVEGPSAGVLLDRAGYRGRGRGGCVLSPMHANFLVNTGSGTSSDALALLEEARSAVRERFGVLLEYEVRMLPCRTS